MSPKFSMEILSGALGALLLAACTSASGQPLEYEPSPPPTQPKAQKSTAAIVPTDVHQVAPAADPAVSNPLESVLRNLDGVGELKTMFNEDAGVPRLLLLVSPT